MDRFFEETPIDKPCPFLKEFRCIIEQCKPYLCFQHFCYERTGERGSPYPSIRPIRNAMYAVAPIIDDHDQRLGVYAITRDHMVVWLEDHPEVVEQIERDLHGL